MTKYPKVLHNGNFKLEKVKPTFAHASHVFNIIDNQRLFLRQWLGWIDNTKRPEDVYPHMCELSRTDNSEYYITMGGKIIGSVGFVRVDEALRTAEIGYWLSRDFNGRGIMTKSVNIMEQFAFDKLNANRVEIRVDVENIPSQRVAIRAGYTREGILRQAFILRGQARDVIVYSKIKNELKRGI